MQREGSQALVSGAGARTRCNGHKLREGPCTYQAVLLCCVGDGAPVQASERQWVLLLGDLNPLGSGVGAVGVQPERPRGASIPKQPGTLGCCEVERQEVWK